MTTKEDFLKAEKVVLEVQKVRQVANGKLSIGLISEMFAIYNKVANANEFNTGCPACRNRVEKNLNSWYQRNKNEFKEKNL